MVTWPLDRSRWPPGGSSTEAGVPEAVVANREAQSALDRPGPRAHRRHPEEVSSPLDKEAVFTQGVVRPAPGAVAFGLGGPFLGRRSKTTSPQQVAAQRGFAPGCDSTCLERPRVKAGLQVFEMTAPIQSVDHLMGGAEGRSTWGGCRYRPRLSIRKRLTRGDMEIDCALDRVRPGRHRQKTARERRLKEHPWLKVFSCRLTQRTRRGPPAAGSCETPATN